MKKDTITSVVVVSDLHCGSALGLLPPNGFVRTTPMDDEQSGNRVKPNSFQVWLWARWLEFWSERNKKWIVAICSDRGDIPEHIWADLNVALFEMVAGHRALGIAKVKVRQK